MIHPSTFRSFRVAAVLAVASGCFIAPAPPVEAPIDRAVAELAARRENRPVGVCDLAEFDAAISLHHEAIVEARAVRDAALARHSGASAALTMLGDASVESQDGELEAVGSLRFDVLGVVGLGRLPCEAAVAFADVVLAEARLAEATVRATIEGRGLLLRRSRLLAERSRLESLRAEIATAIRRSRVLAETGFAGSALAAETTALEAAIETRLQFNRAELSRTAAAITRATGGALGQDELPSISVATFDGDPPLPGLRSPLVQTFVAQLALAEARLRLAASRRWPEIAVGPSFRLSPSPAIHGGMLEIELEDPRRVDAELRASIVERDHAATRLTLAVLDLENASFDGRAEAAANRSAWEAASRAASGATKAEIGMRERYFADPDSAGEWHRMIEGRLEAETMEFESRARLDDHAVELAIAIGFAEVLR